MARMLCIVGVVVLALVSSTGCAVSADALPDETAVLRIILKPATGAGFDPVTPEGLATLADTAETPLVYVRPLAGNAHLIATVETVSVASHGEILRRLAARSDVEYAEEDRRVSTPRKPS